MLISRILFVSLEYRSATAEDALLMSLSTEGIAENWDDIRGNTFLEAIQAKFAQHDWLAQRLLETGQKEICVIDSDSWAGVRVENGVIKGSNSVGKMLMQARNELQKSHHVVG
jgi:predicted NAD-dependent protein-ADP-ribosyltransferase YbiA (DUF1768 family)